jgi:hypothetical protein
MIILRRIFWGVVTFLAIYLSISTFEYLSFRTDINFLLQKKAFIKDIWWMSAFYMHVMGSLVCLGIAPFLFLPTFRKNYLDLHKQLGKAYIFCVLCVGAPSGLYMAFFANGGRLAQIGFTLLSILWIFITYTAYQKIIEKNIIAHKIWMIRSFALTFSAVMLRIWVPLLSYYYEMPHGTTIWVTAWLSWIPNILVAELIIRFQSKYV